MSQPPRDGVEQFQGALDISLDLPLASIGTRAVAHVIDLAVVFLIQIMVLAAFTLALPVMTDDVRNIFLAGLLITNFLILWGYFVACEMLMQGQSPGKRVMNLRVVGRDGAAVDPVSSMIRNLLRYADFLPGVYSAGVISMMASARSQRIGDLAAGTVVVREDRRSERVVAWPEALSAKEVALLEAWTRRAPYLLPHRSEVITGELLAWLRETHPALLGEAGEPGEGDSVQVMKGLVRQWSAG